MNYRVVKLDDFPDDEASLYSIIEEGEENSTFHNFIEDNLKEYPDEIDNILRRLIVIGESVGARESYFKHNEGVPGDGVCALYDDQKKLRLYCIRFGKMALILGGGGRKDNFLGTAWQDNPNLKQEALKMIQVSDEISNRIREKDMWWTNEGKDLDGDLVFN